MKPIRSASSNHARALLLTVLLVSHLVNAAESTAAPAPGPTASVQTLAVRQAPIAQYVQAYGSISFSGANLNTLSLPFAAQVTRLAVAAGQSVRMGIVLAEMAPDPAVTTAFVQAQATLAAARDELKRTQSLYDKQFDTQSQLAAAKKAVTDAQVAVSELQRQGAVPGVRAITAPFDGVVVSVAVAQGDRVAAGMALLQMGRSGKAGAAHLTLGVDPSRAASIRVGAPVEVTSLSGSAEGPHTLYPGTVSGVREALNPLTRMVDVSAELPPTVGAPLLVGTPVAARVEIARSVHWILPRSAVLQDARGDHVYQVAAGRARRVQVQRQVESGNQYGVDGPLDPAQRVVIQGNYELADGMAVSEGGR